MAGAFCIAYEHLHSVDGSSTYGAVGGCIIVNMIGT